MKLKNPKQSTTEHSSPKETVFSAKEFSVPQKTGSATVVNIKKSDIKVLSVTAAALRLQKPASAVSAWVISSLQLRFPTSGISRVSRAVWDWILDISPRVLEKVLYFASYIVLDPGDTGLQLKQVLSEKEYRDAVDKYGLTAPSV